MFRQTALVFWGTGTMVDFLKRLGTTHWSSAGCNQASGSELLARHQTGFRSMQHPWIQVCLFATHKPSHLCAVNHYRTLPQVAPSFIQLVTVTVNQTQPWESFGFFYQLQSPTKTPQNLRMSVRILYLRLRVISLQVPTPKDRLSWIQASSPIDQFP